MKDLNLVERRLAIEDFDLLQCIDRSLEKFGYAVKESIHWKISILYGSPRDALLSNPCIIIQVLRATFRDSAVGIEKHIFNEIVKSFGNSENCSTLEDLLKAMRDKGMLNKASPRMVLCR